MITAKQRTQLKKYLRGDYIPDVLAVLEEHDIVNKHGRPYSDKMISHVLNGRYDNPWIETAIVTVYTNRKNEEEKKRRDLNDLLGIDDNDDE
jgi:hypothetical protein